MNRASEVSHFKSDWQFVMSWFFAGAARCVVDAETVKIVFPVLAWDALARAEKLAQRVHTRQFFAVAGVQRSPVTSSDHSFGMPEPA